MEQTNLSGKVLLVSELPNPVNPETIEVLLKENDQVFTIHAVTKEGDRASLLTDDVILADENGNSIHPRKILEIKEGVKVLTEAIASNSNYTLVKYPESLKRIEKNALSDNRLGNHDLPNVEYIGVGAYNDNGMTEVFIPDSVTEIGYGVFGGGIVSITGGKGLKSYPNFFENYSNLESIEFHEGLESIGNSAFSDTKLESVVLPNSLISLGEEAFLNSTIKTLIIGTGLEVISRNAFGPSPYSHNNTNNIENLEIPSNVRTIEAYAFTKAGITNLTLNEGLEVIGNSSFKGNNITTLTIPDSVQTIELDAFTNNQLTDVEVGVNTIIQDGAFDSSVTITRRP